MTDACRLSKDPAIQKLLSIAAEDGVELAWDRLEAQQPQCGFGKLGLCCRVCHQGPCRVDPFGEGPQRGVCGADAETIIARNFARMSAAGAAAHSDHGRDMALTLLAAAEGHAPNYELRDVRKLLSVAEYLDVPTKDREPIEIAKDVATKALAQFGQQTGELAYVQRAPKKRQEIWRHLGIMPRGIDREIVDVMHRTHIGNDQFYETLLMSAIRVSLGDGWGGSMLSTDITDILFGSPVPLVAKANLGALDETMVNVVVHGHEPILSEMILVAVNDPELIEYAKSKGAAGINLGGLCCTSNETLMRQGVASLGNFLSQELAIVTGAVDLMVVDIQCIMQALGPLTQHYHTKLVTTSPKAHIEGVTHVEFDELRALDIAKQVVRMGIDNYENRKQTHIPTDIDQMVAGFSHEYINYALGGMYRGSFRPLNDAVASGRLRGAAGVVGCNHAGTCQDEAHLYTVRELIKNDVLVVMTGCGAIACAKYGLLSPDAARFAGPGLREICETVGIPPVLHLGSCVDNTRILTVLSQMASEGGLGDDISDLPGAGFAPEWMSEKAISIGCYFAGSGVYTIMGGRSPIAGSKKVTEFLGDGLEARLGGRLEFLPDAQEAVDRALRHIDKKRAALGLPVYDAKRHGQSGDAVTLKVFEKADDEVLNVYSARV
ncbi:MAG TPA: anaerobic carbon-monoxide dehydrogenase catalytic subunit [Anaerolineae bacterium]|nr:anaerobic carbon-monoxide dehydrogenase catalytic subunit [Anaerolineae bacterium]HQJ50787.1 anaerobic carbon-monoxide dehydrogenase catalytic subunit [Anaerolineae bacterium]